MKLFLKIAGLFLCLILLTSALVSCGGESNEPPKHTFSYIETLCLVDTVRDAHGRISAEHYTDISNSTNAVSNLYEYNENGKLTSMSLNVNGEEKYGFEFTYNSDGSVSSAKAYYNATLSEDAASIEYHGNGKLKSFGVKDKCWREYDENGNCITEQLGTLTSRYTYENGRPVSAVAYYGDTSYADFKITCKDGLITSVLATTAKELDTVEFTVSYTSNGKVASRTSVGKHSDGKVYMNGSCINTYDSNGHLARTEISLSTEEIAASYSSTTITEFLYSSDGKRLSEAHFSKTAGGEIIPKYGFEYSYDENGKLIKKTSLLYDSEGNVTNRIPTDINVR